jgi:hypothetical protein
MNNASLVQLQAVGAKNAARRGPTRLNGSLGHPKGKDGRDEGKLTSGFEMMEYGERLKECEL